jgi:SNF2 family DNA or RNA helicase
MIKFDFITKPFAHQLEALQRSCDLTSYALFMEQGTGKTKVILDNVAYLYNKGEINALIVIAPNGVHRNWVTDEAPKHLPLEDYDTLIWRSGKSRQKGFQYNLNALLKSNRFVILAMNVDAVITSMGSQSLLQFLTTKKCMLVVDESTDIKSPGAKRTKKLIHLGKRAKYRRILTGTPSAESPLDLYGQFTFLDPNILGERSFFTFKHEYAIWEKVFLAGRSRPFERAVEYRNLDQLKEKIGPYSFRVTKDEALDLPEKLYTKRYVELSKEQARAYAQMRDLMIAELGNSEIVTADNVLAKMLRLQQIACGYVPVEVFGPEGEVIKSEVRDIPGKNSRLEVLKGLIDNHDGKAIIWARFRHDVDLIINALECKCVRYDGKVKEDERQKAITDFQEGDAKVFIGNPAAGGRGLTLNKASMVVFYSNYFGLETRLQAEDRAHRIGLKHPVLYVDIVAENTVDEKIVTALRNKRSLSDLITGDPTGEWI